MAVEQPQSPSAAVNTEVSAAQPPTHATVLDAASGASDVRARRLLALVSLAALIVGLVGEAGRVEPLRLAWLVLLLLGLGSAPLQRVFRLDPAARLGLSVLLSLSTVLIVGSAMAFTGWWHPRLAFTILAPLAALLHLQALVSLGVGIPLRRPQLRKYLSWSHLRATISPSIASSLLGVALWLPAALTHRHVQPGLYGLLKVMPAYWYLGLVLTVVGLLIGRHDRERDMLIAVLFLMLAMTVTPSLIYDWPRSASAAKHVGLVQQIRIDHKLLPSLDIYNAWGGFFGGAAWLCDVTGIHDPMRLATAWPPIIGLCRLAELRFMVGRVTTSARSCWAAMALVLLADSIGADYFSPQSVGLVLSLGVYAIALSSTRDEQRGYRFLRLGVMLVAGLALAPTHQLSPYIAGGVLAILVVFQVIRPWYTPLLVLGPAFGWALLHWSSLKGFLDLSSIGSVENFRPPVTIGTPGLQRLPIVRETVLALLVSFGIVALGAMIALFRERRQRAIWAFCSCAGCGLIFVAVNPYGNEGVFRAILFAIPWLAIVASRLVAPPVRAVIRSRTGLLGAACAVMLPCFLLSMFGLDASNVIRTGDLDAQAYFETSAPVGARLLSMGGGDLPGRLTARYRFYEGAGLEQITPALPAGAFNAQADVIAITKALVAYFPDIRPTSLYAVWSPVSYYYDWEYGIRTPAESDKIRDALVSSGYWTLVLHKDGTYLFRLDSDSAALVARSS